jgi:transcription elongation factor GreA
MQRNPVTPEGYETLVRDLKNHKENLRPAVVRSIEEARAHGDISENAEYEDAKERQAHIEGRIGELEHLVSSADIIDVKRLPKNGRVVFGTTVVLENSKSGESRTWRIVGETEADVAAGLISYKAPLGKALIGHVEGDEVEVPAPGGVSRWAIVEVRYE